MKRILTAVGFHVLALCGVSASGHDRPFGIGMGMPRLEVLPLLGDYREITPGMLRTQRVPNSQPGLESYAIVVSDTHGVCKIMAVGNDLPLDSSANGLRSAFDAAAAGLDEQFGRRETYDYGNLRLMNHADVDARQPKPVLAASWSPSGREIAHVLLEAVALNSRHGYLRLHYESPFYAACCVSSSPRV